MQMATLIGMRSKKNMKKGLREVYGEGRMMRKLLGYVEEGNKVGGDDIVEDQGWTGDENNFGKKGKEGHIEDHDDDD